jgi:hypothetical protein
MGEGGDRRSRAVRFACSMRGQPRCEQRGSDRSSTPCTPSILQSVWSNMKYASLTIDHSQQIFEEQRFYQRDNRTDRHDRHLIQYAVPPQPLDCAFDSPHVPLFRHECHPDLIFGAEGDRG